MKNLKLLEKYQPPPPPPAIKKKKISIYKKTKKTSLLVKVSTTLNCLNHYEKASLEKFSISQKTLISEGCKHIVKHTEPLYYLNTIDQHNNNYNYICINYHMYSQYYIKNCNTTVYNQYNYPKLIVT